MVQWLRLCASSAGGAGLIPSPGTKISYVTWQKKISKGKGHKGHTGGNQAQASQESLPVESPVLNIFSNEL